MKPHVLVAVPLRPQQLDMLAQLYELHRLDQAASPAEREAVLAAAGPVCSAMVVNGNFRLDGALLDRLPALKMASCSSAGFDQIDLDELTRRGITLTNTSEALRDDVADMAILLMLASRRRLIEGDAYVRTGGWGQKGMFPLTTSSAGKRAGILGLGNIGMAIARRAEALGMTVGYCGRNPKPDVGYKYFADPVALAEWADVLLVATPGGAGTEGLVSAQVIEALGPQGMLVNIARGSVVDEAAMIAALQDGRLGSAGLDVYLSEPKPDPALVALPNVTLSPHHASGTEETRARMAQLTVDNLDAFFAGRPLLTPVN
ncbi:2-hydroxyacid dehydrogenase [Paracoccus suum]|uniref:2-hydroxyacid dehydrogenase n=1 Tax=Paracoccus suum TaxID=2259340 RepID=A0A344PM76_9RHOB|nr:2-hydroxyacid dehydrogenase [Paracoccus suum]AXC50481.1 2-hydroxyacid dehydrogenase [Paracoccus suum]